MALSYTRWPLRLLVGSAGLAAIVRVAYGRPQRLDSAYDPPATKTLVFPKNMPFSRQLTVTQVVQVNHDTKRITFALPGGSSEVSGVGPGGAILTQHTPTHAWFPVVRPYSPVSDPSDRGTLQLLVKKYPKGLASGYLHSLAPDDNVTVRGPIPSYTWKASPKPSSIVLVAGGAGITPMLSLTKGILNNPQDQTRIRLLWGVNSKDDLVVKSELDDLQQKFANRLQITYAISALRNNEELPQPEAGDEPTFTTGHIDKNLLQKAMQKAEDTGSWGDVQGTRIFFCGPPAMQEAIAGRKGILRDKLGMAKKSIHVF